MGCKELIESLRAASSERVNAVWSDASTEADNARAACAQKIGQAKEEAARILSSRVALIRSQALLEARSKERGLRLAADRKMAGLLYTIASSRLRMLRDREYDAVFQALAQELPRFTWKSVKVHPDDVERARTFFPTANITAEEAISGGLEVTSDDGLVTVVNTCEKRLERAWEGMLPELIREATNGTSSRT
jgi:V/A-type H+/Na+-transporting ATPase subunit E